MFAVLVKEGLFNALAYFIKYLFAPLILLLTLFGSTFGLVVLSRDKLKQIGPRSVYIYLLAIEYFNVIIVRVYLAHAFEFDLNVQSVYVCRFYWFIHFVAGATVPLLLFYISLERLVSIGYPSKRFILRKNNYQLVYFICVIAYQSIFYSSVFFYFEIITKTAIIQTEQLKPQEFHKPNKTTNEFINKSKEFCIVNDQSTATLMKYLDLANRVVCPFILMIVCTFFLIFKIFQSRKKFSRQFCNNNKLFNKDLRFSSTSILLNFIYLSLTLPLSVWLLSSYSTSSNYYFVYFFEYLIFFCCSLDFYLIFVTNSLFRDEFFKLFRKN
jgi:hypothetical protein